MKARDLPTIAFVIALAVLAMGFVHRSPSAQDTLPPKNEHTQQQRFMEKQTRDMMNAMAHPFDDPFPSPKKVAKMGAELAQPMADQIKALPGEHSESDARLQKFIDEMRAQ